MASNRHLGRIVALQTLYEQDFRLESGDDSFDLGLVLKRNIARYESTVDDVFFIEELVWHDDVTNIDHLHELVFFVGALNGQRDV